MNKKLKTSIEILKELNHSVQEISQAGTASYKRFYEEQSDINSVIMYSVYGFLVIRASAFFDELRTEFLSNEDLKKTKKLISAVAHFKQLYKIHSIRKFRNYIAHGRTRVGKKNNKRNRRITDSDVTRLNMFTSSSTFESLAIATSRIVECMDELFPKPNVNSKK